MLHVNFLKILYNFETLEILLFKFYCFCYKTATHALVIAERFSGKYWRLACYPYFLDTETFRFLYVSEQKQN